MYAKAASITARQAVASNGLRLAVGSSILLAVAVVIARAVLADSWLDEYWQLWISGAPRDELGGRLLADTHPPWFNLLARAILFLAGGSLETARVVSLIGALGLLIAGTARLSRFEQGWTAKRVYLFALMFILVAGGPLSIGQLGDSFRSYPWIIAVSGLQSLYLLQIAQGRAVDRNASFMAVLTIASVSLHLVHAVGAIAIALATVACALQSGQRRAALFVGGAMLVGIFIDLSVVYFQSVQWALHNDYNWIGHSGVSAMMVFAESAKRTFLGSFVMTFIILAAIVTSRLQPSDIWIVIPFPIAVLTWILLDRITPIIVDRYICSMLTLFCILSAAALDRLNPSHLLTIFTGMITIVHSAANLAIDPPRRSWDSRARLIESEVTKCPGARVYAASAWLFTAGRGTRAAAFEDPVMRFAYQRFAPRGGFPLTYLDGIHASTIGYSVCPTILWVDHAPGIAQNSVDDVLKVVKLNRVPGLVVRRADSPDASVLMFDSR